MLTLLPLQKLMPAAPSVLLTFVWAMLALLLLPKLMPMPPVLLTSVSAMLTVLLLPKLMPLRPVSLIATSMINRLFSPLSPKMPSLLPRPEACPAPTISSPVTWVLLPSRVSTALSALLNSVGREPGAVKSATTPDLTPRTGMVEPPPCSV